LVAVAEIAVASRHAKQKHEWKFAVVMPPACQKHPRESPQVLKCANMSALKNRETSPGRKAATGRRDACAGCRRSSLPKCFWPRRAADIMLAFQPVWGWNSNMGGKSNCEKQFNYRCGWAGCAQNRFAAHDYWPPS
jgi:hypothetical protein